MKHSVCLAIVLLLGFVVPADAQEAQNAHGDTVEARHASLELIARSMGDSVILRWGPSRPGAWAIAKRNGYIVDRYRMLDGDRSKPVFERLTQSPLKPWPLDEWRRRTPRENRYAAIAAQVLHGAAAVPDPRDVNSLRNASLDLSNRHGFGLFAADNDALAAEGLALRLVDRNVKIGERYIYRVYLADPDPTYRVDTGYLVIDVEARTPLPPPLDVEAEGRDGRVVLSWKESPSLAYSGYRVYRAEPGSQNYQLLTLTPVVALTPIGARDRVEPSYHDTTIVNYRRYNYRITGVSPFAEESDPAEVTQYGRDLTAPPMPHIGKPMQIGPKDVRITWEMPNSSADLNGFVVARSYNADNGFVALMQDPLSKGSREYVDRSAGEGDVFYKVGAVDTAGNVSPSLVAHVIVIDSAPPAPPRGLTGTIDTNGIVQLRWQLGPEDDIIGYRVLWANDPTHEFTQRTNIPIKDTFFVDTISLKTLTQYVYYRVAALDERKNHSEMSEMLAIRRPDLIPPDASVFQDVFVTDSAVRLLWNISQSIDLKEQRLYRRAGETGSWGIYKTFGPKINTFTDRDVEQGKVYDYQLEAVDSAGHVSERAMAVRGRPYDPGTREEIQKLNATFHSDGRVHLTWSYPRPPKENHWFVIYRSVGNFPPSIYKAVEQGKSEFFDDSLPQKGWYKYAIKVRTAKGGESVLSSEVAVEVK